MKQAEKSSESKKRERRIRALSGYLLEQKVVEERPFVREMCPLPFVVGMFNIELSERSNDKACEEVQESKRY